MLARRMTVPDPVVKLDRMLRGLSPVRGNLVVGEEINRGAYGVVFKGRLHGEPVAVKKIHELHQTAATAEALCRLFGGLLEEGNMLASINHPHIVRGFGAFFDEDSQQPVIVMELMLVDLRTYLENNQGSLKMSKQIPICLQIALGVQFLHHLSPPIAHRDLNDKNVLLDEDGTVKIGDLGQSKYKREKVDFFNTLAPGAPLYMAPEATLPVGNDRARYTESVDIFSLGVLAVEVADGSPLDQDVPDRREEYLKRMGKSHPLKPLVKKCLHENYRKRPVIDQVIDEITPLAVETDIETVRHNEERLEHMKDVLRDIEREIAEIESHHITEDQLSARRRLEREKQVVGRNVTDLERECAEMKQQIIDKHQKAKKFQFSSKCRKEVKHFKKELKVSNHKSRVDSEEKRCPRFFQFRSFKKELEVKHFKKELKVSNCRSRADPQEKRCPNFFGLTVSTVLTTLCPNRRIMRRITSDPGLTSDVEQLVVMSTQERPLLTTSKSTTSFLNSY